MPAEQASVTDFLKQNVDVEPATLEVPFKRFNSPFVIKEITNRKIDEIRNSATKKAKNPKNGQIESTTDQTKMAELMVVESVVTPDLTNEALQKSYGDLADPIGLIKDMLSVGELNDLTEKVSELSGLNQDNLKKETDEVKK